MAVGYPVDDAVVFGYPAKALFRACRYPVEKQKKTLGIQVLAWIASIREILPIFCCISSKYLKISLGNAEKHEVLVWISSKVLSNFVRCPVKFLIIA